ncbi:MAG: hypothetical protein V8Q57_08485 [Blautia sp.]
MILAMVDYFVTMFRGNAFVLMDVLSVGTAMEVAGTYVFKMPIKTGICIVAMLLYIVYQHSFQTLRVGKKDKKWYLVRVGLLALLLVGIYGTRPGCLRKRSGCGIRTAITVQRDTFINWPAKPGIFPVKNRKIILWKE